MPGSKFVLDMDQAALDTYRTKALLSPEYITSNFTPSEWDAAFAQYPTGEHCKLLSIFVRVYALTGFLAQLIYLGLANLDITSATAVVKDTS